jgi:hypothetical protein
VSKAVLNIVGEGVAASAVLARLCPVFFLPLLRTSEREAYTSLPSVRCEYILGVTKADILPRPSPCPMSPPGLDQVERSIRDWNLTHQLTSLPWMKITRSTHQCNAFEGHHPEVPLDAAAGMNKLPLILPKDRLSSKLGCPLVGCPLVDSPKLGCPVVGCPVVGSSSSFCFIFCSFWRNPPLNE